LELLRTSNAEMISLDSTTKFYAGFEAISPASIRIKKGERVVFLGPTGSGKTTLLLLISGQLSPTSGRVTLDGIDLKSIQSGRNLSRLVGMIPQQFDLVPNLSVLHNVLAGRLGEWGFFRALFSLIFPQESLWATNALDRVGLAGLANSRGGNLSGGEQQRVAIARLLVQDPAVILADEPVASLDPTRGEEILKLLLAIAGAEKTLIASMHSVSLARSYFNRVIGVRNGSLHFDLPTEMVTNTMLDELYSLEGLRNARQGTESSSSPNNSSIRDVPMEPYKN
jgi:phosphonate transport system ATP-binding protein